jgi:hypothetical protein
MPASLIPKLKIITEQKRCQKLYLHELRTNEGFKKSISGFTKAYSLVWIFFMCFLHVWQSLLPISKD